MFQRAQISALLASASLAVGCSREVKIEEKLPAVPQSSAVAETVFAKWQNSLLATPVSGDSADFTKKIAVLLDKLSKQDSGGSIRKDSITKEILLLGAYAFNERVVALQEDYSKLVQTIGERALKFSKPNFNLPENAGRAGNIIMNNSNLPDIIQQALKLKSIDCKTHATLAFIILKSFKSGTDKCSLVTGLMWNKELDKFEAHTWAEVECAGKSWILDYKARGQEIYELRPKDSFGPYYMPIGVLRDDGRQFYYSAP